MKALTVLLALGLAPSLTAAAPLIYEGRLTTGEPAAAPAHWPGLRFSVIDADGHVWWSTMVEPEGPRLDARADGHFVAYLEGSPDNPLVMAGLDGDRWLRVDVCPGQWPDDPQNACEWVALGDAQPLGSVPRAETLSAAARARIRAEVLAELWVAPDVPGGTVATLRVSRGGGPDTFGSVPAALASLSHKRIPHGTRVEIRIAPADEPYAHDEPIVIDREDGGRLHIIGEPPAPGSFLDVVLAFPDSAGIVIGEGARLGLLDGVTLRGGGVPDPYPTSGARTQVGASAVQRLHGVLVRPQGFARLGADVRVESFGADCLHAFAATLLAPGVTLRDCGDEGAQAHMQAFIDLSGADVVDARYWDMAATWGSGIMAEHSSLTSAARGAVADADSWMSVYGAAIAVERSAVVADDNSFMFHGRAEFELGEDCAFAR